MTASESMPSWAVWTGLKSTRNKVLFEMTGLNIAFLLKSSHEN